MNDPIKSSLLFFLIVLSVRAETAVMVDAAFPYRIICGTQWIQELKSDSLLQLKNTATGKKTRFQLHKYTIDTVQYDSLSRTNQTWSRLRYAVNYKLAQTAGRVIRVDSTANKKLGKYRAFELVAYFSEKSGTGTLWWAEYSRWTDHNGSGYLASIIGDTLDILNNENFTNYKALLDSISLSRLTTTLNYSRFMETTSKSFDKFSAHSYNVLGRDVPERLHTPAMILMKKNMKRCLIR